MQGLSPSSRYHASIEQRRLAAAYEEKGCPELAAWAAHAAERASWQQSAQSRVAQHMAVAQTLPTPPQAAWVGLFGRQPLQDSMQVSAEPVLGKRSSSSVSDDDGGIKRQDRRWGTDVMMYQ